MSQPEEESDRGAGGYEYAGKHLRSFRGLGSRARNRRTTPARRNPAISSAQNFRHPRNPRNPYQRPAPPDLPRQCHRRVRAAVLGPVAQQKFHLQHQFLARQSQQRPDPRILQRRQRHPAPLQNRRNPPCDSRAEPALRVKKQPPSRMPSLPVRVLTHQRNHDSFSSLLLAFISIRVCPRMQITSPLLPLPNTQNSRVEF